MGNKSYTIRKRFEVRRIDMWGVTTTSETTQIYPQTRTGKDTPHFKALAAKGLYATNYMSASRRDASFFPSAITLLYVKDPYKGKSMYTEMHHPFPGPASSIDGSALNKALNDAATQIRKKIQAENSTFSGPTFLGELRETAHMIRKPAEALADYLNKSIDNAARKKRKKQRPKRKGSNPLRKKSAANTAGSTWLEISFGALPFINDIASIAEASLRRYEESRIKRVSAVGFGENSLSTVVRPTSGPDYIRYNRNIERTEEVQVKFTVGLRTSVSRSNNALERVIEQSRMDWREIVPAAWELLPGSFLLDYFGNIGDILSAASVSLANVAWVQKTTRTRNVTTDTGISISEYSSDLSLGQSSVGRSRSVYTTTKREAASIPIPEFRFELPGRKTQLLNLAALLSGFL